MKVITLFFALLAAPTWCEKHYSVAYAAAELHSEEGMRDVLGRIEKVAETYCSEHPLVNSYQSLHACRRQVVTKLANKVGHAHFRDFVRQSPTDRLVRKGPILI